ncbi:DNA primase [Candidatus Uhrbacteria bacterium]|nr:DNA primase [Candidatus Uhrbacteria bacterium]
MDPIEEIKSRIDIVDLLREYMQLGQAGSNYKARCPFHQEKTPSFIVSQPKQIWYCFGGCNDGGDIFKFIMKHEGVDFAESLRILAQRAGVELQRQDPQASSRKTRISDVLDHAAHAFAASLKKSPRAEIARDYVRERGLTADLVDEFLVGYAPADGDVIAQYLLSKKFALQDVIDAGLAVKRERGYGSYDRFRGRLMIPIRDVHGHIVGFGGRILEEKEGSGPKYLNSPQTLVYDKSRVVFGLDRAKQEIRKQGYCILVEGYMDFFSVYQAGMQNVVASSGTALTAEQVRLIKRFADTLLFAFDTDAAGGNATVRGIEVALSEGAHVKVIELPRSQDGRPAYKDPDECIRKDPAAWQRAVQDAKGFLDFHFERVLAPCSRSTDPHEKRKAVLAFFSVLRLVPDRITQDHWIKIVAHTLDLSESVLWEEMGGRQERATQRGEEVRPRSRIAAPDREEVILSLLISDPTLIDSIRDILDPTMFLQESHRAACATLYEHGNVHDQSFADRLTMYAEYAYAALDERERKRTLVLLAAQMRERVMRTRIQELRALMKSAEQSGDSVAVDRYAREFSNLVSSGYTIQD